MASGYKRTRKRKGEGGMEIRKKLKKKETEMAVDEEGIMVGYVRQDRERWRIVGVYVNRDIEQKLRKVEHWMEDKEKGLRTIIKGE